MIKYARVIQSALASPWAILPEKLVEIRNFLLFRSAGGVFYSGSAIKRENRRAGNVSGVAVLPLVGTIIPRMNLFAESSGAVSLQRFTHMFRAAMADPAVGEIIIDVDSPGGQVTGVAELADEIYQARGVKPVTAVAHGLAASAAYWIASAAEKLVVTPTGEIGGIGVFAIHQDVSRALEHEGISVTLISAGKYKTEANPFEPLTPDARDAIQRRVDDYYNMFVTAVSVGRGVGFSDARDRFVQGRLVGAVEAVAIGMADEVATLDEVLQRHVGNNNGYNAEIEYRRRRLRAFSR